MRASTLFALTVAVLIGLGVAVAAKMSGLFNSPVAKAPPPPPPPVKVLAAATNLFSGSLMQASNVYVRELKPDEMKHYQENKDKYLPPVVTSVSLRITKKDIHANQPILVDDLEKMEKPSPLTDRLLPTMRAVSLSVSKDQSAGGLIQVGDWVDVLVTSQVSDDRGTAVTKTAVLAPRVRVIAKRNSLWPIFAPLPEKKPVQFTVEVNPYRAALIEFVKFKGELTLTPLSTTAQHALETRRSDLLKQGHPIKQVHFIEDDSPEAEREESLVIKYNRGELSVGDHDMIELFGMNLATNPPPEDRLMIEQMVGMNHYNPAMFADNGKRILPGPRVQGNSGSASPTVGFQFQMPEYASKCESCKNKKKY